MTKFKIKSGSMEENIDTVNPPENNQEYAKALTKSIAQAENNELIVFSM